MIIERISLLNFKNIAEAELTFSPKMNCLFGQNGMGKTNLLDAVYYLSFTKNHNNLADSQLIRHGEDFCVLQGFYQDGDKPEEVYCGIKRKHRKAFKRNKKEYDRLSEHIGLIPLVMVSPDDINLIRGGSDERRKFVDMIISQYDREYLHSLIQYNKALFQRNSLLKGEAIPDDSLLDILEEQLAYAGNTIHAGRQDFFNRFLPVFKEYYQEISSGGEWIDMRYESHLNDASLIQLLADRRGRDRLLGYTTAGIHKDDFDFLLDDYLIRKTGSQGQNKTYLVALKLAQFAFLSKKGPSTPILLLDDVFDKLDAQRVEKIIQLVARPEFGQIFMTDTNRHYLNDILASIGQQYKLFEVRSGAISELL